ncbi:hypothetical protein HMPREF0204_10120 [Chryseobacterium gleum ATCC 35910]|uniref:Uncharacterized protein n=1 Tax=Chryseobacterium gleum ATCC 35910 TaxID=525257 RepID=A0ABN0AYD2_CHRGE|nr:hypothetical protein HMPREF0204_10120 [Chryseobacterium gleum ATCC 35910]
MQMKTIPLNPYPESRHIIYNLSFIIYDPDVHHSILNNRNK